MTERKVIDEELRASEAQYRRLVEHSPYAIVIHAQGRVVYLNNSAVQLLAASDARQLLGRAMIDT